MVEARALRGPEGAAVELLAPAGTMEAFNAALAAGADAIYVGLGNDFNARRSATNLTEEDLAAATARAHLAGSRVYVTMNVVIKDKEMPHALRRARRAWTLGADALIVQDLGLLYELRSRWPEMECHASTQMSVMDARGCAFASGQGVSRVTLARELSLGEIGACAASGVDVEVFGHGALCLCYSGLCLMSSLGGGRSANRGLCAQPCRLPYTLVGEDGRRVAAPGNDRPLCPRDLRTDGAIADLVERGVTSIKVEGRMKAPEYVHAVTSAYRGALDALGASRHDVAPPRVALGDDARDRLLSRSFNRDFTCAYLHGASDNDLMSYERSNNRGELVGTVVASRSLGRRRVRHGGGDGGRERFRSAAVADVDVAFDRPVGAGDLIELRPVADESQFVTVSMPTAASAGSRVTLRTSKAVPPRSTVRVIRSQAALDAVRAVDAACPRHRLVDVRIVARLGQAFTVILTTSDGAAAASASGEVVETARTRAVAADELIEHASRLGGTPFAVRRAQVDMDDGVGMSFSSVHHVRALAVRRLAAELLAPYELREQQAARAPQAKDLSAHLRHVRARDGRTHGRVTRGVEVCALVTDLRTAQAAASAGATRIYGSSDVFGDLRSSGLDVTFVPWLDEICRQQDHDRLDRWIVPNEPVAVGNLSELSLARDRGALAEVRPCIPVHNASAIVALEQEGAAGLWLSGELSLAEMGVLAPWARMPVGVVVYGRARAMTSEHCVLQSVGACQRDCTRCSRRLRPHYLVGVKGARYPVTTDVHGRSRVWAARPLDVIAHAQAMVSAGITRLMVDATLLSSEKTAEAVARVVDAVRADAHGRLPAEGDVDATSGHLFAEVL